MFTLERGFYSMAPRPSLRGTTLKRAIYPPAGTTTFDLVMGVLKTLQSDYGAVVTEVDVSPQGMQFDLKLPAELQSLRLVARRRMLQVSYERVKERLEYCRQLRDIIQRQRVEIERRRMWMAAVGRTS